MESEKIISEVKKAIKFRFEKEDYIPKIEGTGGVFVTLKKHGKLRGCMGTMNQDKLSKNLWLAVKSVLKDPRFDEVTQDELNDLEFEVTVLGKPWVSSNPDEEIIIGKHGVYIEKGGKTGLLLPQVATKTQMDKFEFLDAVCEKAGLNKGEWKDAKIWLFEGRVYKEG